MGDVVEFPKTAVKAELMQGHAVDLRRVISLLRTIRNIFPGVCPEMWEVFEEQLMGRINGFTGIDIEDRPRGVFLTVMTKTVVGECRFGVLVYNSVLGK
jgi:hypothetical protein